MWKLARRVKFEKEFIQISFCGSGDRMGLYTYDGEEIFSQAYYFIECIEVNIFGKKQTLFAQALADKNNFITPVDYDELKDKKLFFLCQIRTYSVK